MWQEIRGSTDEAFSSVATAIVACLTCHSRRMVWLCHRHRSNNFLWGVRANVQRRRAVYRLPTDLLSVVRFTSHTSSDFESCVAPLPPPCFGVRKYDETPMIVRKKTRWRTRDWFTSFLDVPPMAPSQPDPRAVVGRMRFRRQPSRQYDAMAWTKSDCANPRVETHALHRHRDPIDGRWERRQHQHRSALQLQIKYAIASAWLWTAACVLPHTKRPCTNAAATCFH